MSVWVIACSSGSERDRGRVEVGLAQPSPDNLQRPTRFALVWQPELSGFVGERATNSAGGVVTLTSYFFCDIPNLRLYAYWTLHTNGLFRDSISACGGRVEALCCKSIW